MPVCRLADFRALAGDLADRIDQQQRIDHLAAGFALIAGGAGLATVVAGAAHVAVGQEALGLGVVELLGAELGEVTLVVDAAEKLLADALVSLAVAGLVRAAKNVEIDAQAGEVLLLPLVEVRADLLGAAAGAQGGDFDGHAVVVAAADEADVVTAGTHVAHVRIRRQIGAGHVSDVQPSVGIWQSGCNGVPAGHLCGAPPLSWRSANHGAAIDQRVTPPAVDETPLPRDATHPEGLDSTLQKGHPQRIRDGGGGDRDTEASRPGSRTRRPPT